jgi:hypothetical protein
MLPELAAVYVTGLVPSAAVTGLHLVLFQRKMASPEVLRLQSNLAKLDLFWAESRGEIRRLNEGLDTPLTDRAAYVRHVRWVGLLTFFLSWPGAALHILLMISLRYLAKPRLERAIGATALVTQALETIQIQAILEDLDRAVMNARIPKGEGSREN